MTSAKMTPVVACVAIAVIAAAYLVFLYASWHDFQQDRGIRDQKMDALLDRLPLKSPPLVIPDVSAGS